MDSIVRINSKGQAAITDAMFFLMIASGLAIMVLFFATNYGSNVSQSLHTQFGSQFIDSALKTLFYSSIARDLSEDVSKAVEVDYLLSYLKEDFADDLNFDLNTKKIMLERIKEIMKPMQDSFDYCFYAYCDSDKCPEKYPLFILKLFDESTKKIRFFFCEPTSQDKVSYFFVNFRSIYRSSTFVRAPMLSRTLTSGFEVSWPRMEFALVMWIASGIPQNSLTELNCREAV